MDARPRSRPAGIPDEVGSTSKPNQAWEMQTGGCAQCAVCMGSIYGNYRSLRLWLENPPKEYVLAVSAKEYLPIGTNRKRVSEVGVELPAEGWIRLSDSNGAKGPRWGDRACR